MRDYLDRRVTQLKRVTSPIWGTPPPCKQALNIGRVRTGRGIEEFHFPGLESHGVAWSVLESSLKL